MIVRNWLIMGAVALGPTMAAVGQDTAPAMPAIDVWGDFPRVDAGRPFKPLDGAWPSRVRIDDAAGMGVIVPVMTPILRPEGRRVGMQFPTRLIAEVPDAAVLLGDRAFRVLTEGAGAFVVRAEPAPEGTPVPRRQQNLAAETFRFVSGQPIEPGVVRIERTWFAYFPPVAGSQAGAESPVLAGVVLLMPGMFGTPETVLDGLSRSLRGRGLGVLRMIAQPGRFTERLDLTLNPGEALPTLVAGAAREFDSREAECAYAAEEAWKYLAKVKPETAGVPRVIVGFSAGAITLPTVVARTPGMYAAAVAVGGGCHWWLLNEKSNYRTMIDAINVTWTTPPADADLHAAREAYLDASVLDPFNTSQVLRGMPVVMIQGASDLAVPSPLGDCLWERAGKPERWMVEGGHEVLFMQLSGYYERIGAWVTARVEEAAAMKHPQEAK